MTLDKFIDMMSSKMAAIDYDDEIRQTFLMFDSQCMYIISKLSGLFCLPFNIITFNCSVRQTDTLYVSHK